MSLKGDTHLCGRRRVDAFPAGIPRGAGTPLSAYGCRFIPVYEAL